MAPKGAYNRNRMAACAAEAASTSRMELTNASELKDLSCDYIHIPDEANMCADGSLRRTALLTFRWRLKTHAGHEENCDVVVRTNNVTARRVPLPPHWATAINCLSLDRWCEETASKVRVPDISDVRCLALGQVKEPPAPSDGTGPGRIVPLQVEGARVVFLMCAQVQDGLWLCNRGSFQGDALAEDPFQE